MWAVLALSLLIAVVQIAIVRPRLWPAGAGFTLSGDTIFAGLAAPQGVPRIRPPDVATLAGARVTVESVAAGGAAAAAGITAGAVVTAVGTPRDTITLPNPLPTTSAELLRIWRAAYWLGVSEPVTLTVTTATRNRAIELDRTAVWNAEPAVQRGWLRGHAASILQLVAFVAGALTLVLLGTSGMTARLMTLALLVAGIANGGSLLGAEADVPMIGPLLLLINWVVTPLAFPVIGLALLCFPRRAPVLDGRPWIYGALIGIVSPMLVVSMLSALFLLGSNAVLSPLVWTSTHSWLFDVSFALALAANILIALEGVVRYRHNPDVVERRRIQFLVFTGVPAVIAYGIRTGVPVVSALVGWPTQLPWIVELLLIPVILLPALGLPYAVAVKRVLSPRTVLRRSLQYALARKTLSVVMALPVIALIVSLIQSRNRPLADIVVGQPIFFLIMLALAAIGFRKRERAQRWLDRRFFRAEYDAREILMSLASRVPYETDPRALVPMVLSQIDTALNPESAGVLAGETGTLEAVAAIRHEYESLPTDSALASLLRWSDEPLEVVNDDERSPVRRLPVVDRQWLERAGAALLVPILSGTGDARSLIGVVILGDKRSEEPYTAEDRRLLSGIAAHMSLALDLSMLRRRASDATVMRAATTPTLTPTMVATTSVGMGSQLGMCPACQRCFDLSVLSRDGRPLRCPEHGQDLQPVAGMPAVVDAKYRVDAVIGRGGMGAVFRARDLRLERDVAIKIVRADLVANPESRARFRREAQIVARLQHPSVVTIFDYGDLPEGATFLVMEFLRGEDLRHLLKREGALEPTRTLALIEGVAMGVDAAHRAGVLHRDLKPENVLLPSDGGAPKVLDFGVAKLTDATSDGGLPTHGATIVGTPAYMAPEQLRGEAVDARADVFSLGVMTYEALTGTLPFGAGSFIDIGLQQAAGSNAVDRSRLPASLAGAVLRAIATDRDTRTASAAAFVEDLRSAPA